MAYQERLSVAEKWDDYLAQELGTHRAEEIDFTRSMVELDRLLTQFHDDNLRSSLQAGIRAHLGSSTTSRGPEKNGANTRCPGHALWRS